MILWSHMIWIHIDGCEALYSNLGTVGLVLYWHTVPVHVYYLSLYFRFWWVSPGPVLERGEGGLWVPDHQRGHQAHRAHGTRREEQQATGRADTSIVFAIRIRTRFMGILNTGYRSWIGTVRYQHFPPYFLRYRYLPHSVGCHLWR